MRNDTPVSDVAMQPRVRILHVVSSLSRNSGVMHVIMNYYRHIDLSKFQFGFCYFVERDDNFSDEIRKLGGEVFKIMKPNLGIRFRENLTELFRKLVQSYQVLHMHEAYLVFLFSPVAKKVGFSAVIAHSHATKYSDKPLSAIRNRILCRGITKKSDIQLACSNAAGEFLYGKNSWLGENTILLRNAIDCNRFRFSVEARNRIREEFSLEDHYVIGHVGRFIEQKNHIFFLELIKGLKGKSNLKVKFLFVGDGPLQDSFIRKAKELGLNNEIVLTGIRGDIPSLLSAMDVFVLPSLFEGLPVSCIEAQASGLPVVLSNTITPEVGILNYQFLPLTAGSSQWIEAIMNARKLAKREESYKEVRAMGYDIEQESRNLERIYLEAAHEESETE